MDMPAAQPTNCRFVALLLTSLVLIGEPTSARAQQDADGPAVVGRVLDAETNAPIRSAFVRVLPTERGVFSDEQGNFRLPVEEMDAYFVLVGQVGYSDSEVILEAEELAAPVEVRLERDPIAVEGLTVLHDRFSERRNKYAGVVWALDSEDLARSPATTAYDLILRRASVRPCPSGPLEWCVWRRGRLEPIEVWIDERPTWAGLDWLDDYAPEDLYLLEIFDRGRMIRAVTRKGVRDNVRRITAATVLPAQADASFGWGPAVGLLPPSPIH